MTVMPETDDIGTEKEEAGAFSVVNSASKDWRNSKECPTQFSSCFGATLVQAERTPLFLPS